MVNVYSFFIFRFYFLILERRVKYKPVDISSPCGVPERFSLAIAVLAASIANRSAKSVLQVETVSAKAKRCI